MAMSRKPTAAARRAAIEASDHIERSEAWNGLRAGDPVAVSRAGIAEARAFDEDAPAP